MPPDTDTLARLAYDAFYAALDVRYAPLGWDALRPRVQAAWRRVVEVVRKEGEEERDGMAEPGLD